VRIDGGAGVVECFGCTPAQFIDTISTLVKKPIEGELKSDIRYDFRIMCPTLDPKDILTEVEAAYGFSFIERSVTREVVLVTTGIPTE